MDDYTPYYILAGVLYFAPTFIAARGRRASIFFMNLFCGLSWRRWMVAATMAIRSREAAAMRGEK